MKVLVDLDGVVVDSIPLILNVMNRAFATNYTMDELIEYEFNKMFGRGAKSVFELMELNIYRNANPIHLAKEVLERLIKRGIEIYYVTSRSKKYKDVTCSWLQRYDFPYPERVMFTRNKSSYAVEEGIDFCIEDAPEFILDYMVINKPVIVFDYPYNRNIDIKNGIRVKNWAEIEKYLVHQKNIEDKVFRVTIP